MSGLVSNIASSATLFAINKLERKISGKGAVRAGKGFTLFISNEHIDVTFKIAKPFERSGVLTDGVTEAVKHELKKSRWWASWCFANTFGCFNGTTYNFFCDKSYFWKRGHANRKRIL